MPVYGMTRYEYDEKNDPENYTVFLADLAHGAPPWKPLFFIESWGRWCYRSIQKLAEQLSLPTTKGWDVRYIDGYPYLAVIETTEEEAREREPLFREKIRPYIEDFDAIWEQRKTEIMDIYAKLKSDYNLYKYEDITGLSNVDLLDIFDDYLQVSRKQWDIHMELLVPAYYLFGLFDQICSELLGFGNSDARFSKLMTGYDSMVFRFNKEIQALAKRAKELGLTEVFQNADDSEAVITGLEKSDNGKKWLGEYRDFLEVHGWRCERMLDWATPNWIEKPALGIPAIKIAIATGGSREMDERRQRSIKEREETEKEVLSGITANQKAWFSALMKSAQRACYWSEDHTYYLDLYCHAIGRWITKEIGNRFEKAGVIDESEDVYFLIADEIEKALIPMGKVKLHKYVIERKMEWEGYNKLTPSPHYGDIDRVQEVVKKDPVITVATATPVVREDIKADLYSAASAPGITEGIARVIISEDRLGELKKGEILVASGISALWTPSFEMISGIVTDGGGALSHAVIVAREYGIPAVVGCLEATAKIKTGDRVKVDGDLGLVYILEKA
ncbi:PEP-utilizing enzyme [Chloroflexota bacterium]